MTVRILEKLDSLMPRESSYQPGDTFIGEVTYQSGVEAGAILQEAAEIVQGARQQTHGDKERSFQLIAELWEAYIAGRREGRGAAISARNVAQMLELLKIARSVQGTSVRDHYVDAAGYAGIAGELAALEPAST